MKKRIFTIAAIFFLLKPVICQQIIPLYDGPAPGSETWTWEEKETSKTPFGFKIRYNITKPIMEMFLPDSAISNRAAILVCPGGLLRVVNFEHEGSAIAKKLSKEGFTVFVLTYRVARSVTEDPWKEMMNGWMKDREKFDQVSATARDLAANDALTALRNIKKNAPAFNIDTNRIGCLGFSGGAGLVIGLTQSKAPEDRPGFIGMIYSAYRTDSTREMKQFPPTFIASASDDQLAPPVHSVQLFNDIISAGRSAELHIYSKGGHGLKGKASSTWINRFTEWTNQLFHLPSK